MAHRLVLLAAWLLLPFAAQAITWDFDTDGDTQGWVARDGQGTGAIGSAPLYSEVRAGVWRITPLAFYRGITPAVLLNSPLIKKDSGLFDRFRIRLRVVHSRPYQSGISLKWRNTWISSTRAPTF